MFASPILIVLVLVTVSGVLGISVSIGLEIATKGGTVISLRESVVVSTGVMAFVASPILIVLVLVTVSGVPGTSTVPNVLTGKIISPGLEEIIVVALVVVVVLVFFVVVILVEVVAEVFVVDIVLFNSVSTGFEIAMKGGTVIMKLGVDFGLKIFGKVIGIVLVLVTVFGVLGISVSIGLEITTNGGIVISV